MRTPGGASVLGFASLFAWIRRGGSGRRRWRDRAIQAVDAGEHLSGRLASDLTVSRSEGHTPSSVVESHRLVDLLAGRLAELATGPADHGIHVALVDLRDEVERLRTCVSALGASGAGQAEGRDPAGVVGECGRQLIVFDAALRAFREAVFPPTRRGNAR